MALLHGTADEIVPYWTVEDFATQMQEAGNRCELYPYEGAGHLFHQPHRAHFLSVIETFLASLDYVLQGIDASSGELAWQTPLPQDADTSVDSFLLGRDALYLDVHEGRLEISLATGQVAHLPKPDPDDAEYAERPGHPAGRGAHRGGVFGRRGLVAVD